MPPDHVAAHDAGRDERSGGVASEWCFNEETLTMMRPLFSDWG